MKINRRGNKVSFQGLGRVTGEQLKQFLAGHSIPLTDKTPEAERRERAVAQLHHAMRNAGCYRPIEHVDRSICE
jgi:hypothetical protein